MSTRTQPSGGNPLDQKLDRSVTLLFAGLMVTMLLASLNQTVLSTALPTIVGELHGVDQMLWIITGFILASTIMMPIYGKISDLLGRKPVLLSAITIFVGGSVYAALAGDMTDLIVARVIQGVGGGGLMILSQAAIADVIPARQRGKYMGIMGGVFAFSSVAGPLLGGWFTEGPGWRWVFWISLPLGILAAAATIAFLPAPRKLTARPRIDYAGMTLVALATSALVLVTTWGGGEYAWGSPVILGLIATTVVAGAAFVWVESRAAEPIIPMYLFARRNFTVTTIAALLTGVAMFGAISYLPTYLQMTTGLSATVVGLLMVPMMGSMLVTSVITGRMVTATGRYKALPIFGSVVLGIALALLSMLQYDSPTWLVCVYMAVMGLGLGSSMQILTLIVQNTFPVTLVGTATAATNYFRQVGATLGTAVVGSLFTGRLTEQISDRIPMGTGPSDGAHSLTPELVNQMPTELRQVIIEAYHDALIPVFLYMVPLAVVAALVLLLIHEKPLATSIEENVTPESLAEGQLVVDDAAPGAGVGSDTSGTARTAPQPAGRS
ncbi:MDR family MFS transporter [Ornithinicoccus hortensis]|uniref:EmrB/QacA subfamily drug resistance transporter n=1 Tax=Ornithinicoccus hortensis TaxID=82346 RepID=A0A542YST4_9MICO|nr:MDR family MFS transporter [Ornithinicoccus hortensis]TQL51156.1 EmrB/QacA subfamily drug resistance transporter [Ornithinicoccus hortensis]